jgi:hypothetical protein
MSPSLCRVQLISDNCLYALQKYSSEAAVFLLVHKMDLAADRVALLERRTHELQGQYPSMCLARAFMMTGYTNSTTHSHFLVHPLRV